VKRGHEYLELLAELATPFERTRGAYLEVVLDPDDRDRAERWRRQLKLHLPRGNGSHRLLCGQRDGDAVSDGSYAWAAVASLEKSSLAATIPQQIRLLAKRHN